MNQLCLARRVSSWRRSLRIEMNFRFSIKTTWYALILMISLVPLCFVLLWSSLKLHEQLLANALARQQQQNEVVRLHITHEIRRLITLMENKSDPMAYTLEHNQDKRLLDEMLDKVSSRESSMHSLLVLWPDGSVITALENHDMATGLSVPENRENVAEHWKFDVDNPPPAITLPLQGHEYIGDTQQDKEGMYFNVSVPIGPLNKPIAVLLVSIDTAILWDDLMKNISPSDVTSYIVNRKGLLLSSSAAGKYSLENNLAGIAAVQAFIDDADWDQSRVYQGVSGAPVFGSLAKIGIVDWGVISEVKRDAITGPIYQSLFRYGIIILIPLLVLLALGFMSVGRIVRSITAISDEFRRAGKQDYSPAMLSSRIREIQSLVFGFNQMLEQIGISHEKLQQAAVVFETTAEGVMITDVNHQIVAINSAFTGITGYSESDALGKKASILNPNRYDADFLEPLHKEIEQAGEWQGEIWNQRKDDEIFPALVAINAVKNDAGEVTHYVSVFSDITSIKQTEERLSHLAHHDSLTGLPNRVLLNFSLEQAIKRGAREDKQVAVLFLDLDRFKIINDSLGHAKGDRMLEVVATRLSAGIREVDVIARLGGDEFVVVIDGLDKASDASLVAESLLDRLATPFQVGTQEIYINASIGISVFPRDGRDIETLVKNADAAMYRAKEQGGNNYKFYIEDLTTAAFERLSLETSLRHALQRNEFVLYYQPQVSLQTGALVGIEALIRWQHPELGLVPPNSFIPIAEETGLIVPIGEWVLHTACKQRKAWNNVGYLPAKMAVNLSARQFHTKGLVEQISNALESTGLESRYLELELTESMMMLDVEATIKIMNELDHMGVELSIDDFGTGYSSLSYMKQFPIDKLKIDQSFVRDIGVSQDDAGIVNTIIALGHSMNLRVIAEGVETRGQLDYLREHGCDEVQGYFYGHPVPADEFEAFFDADFDQPASSSAP